MDIKGRKHLVELFKGSVEIPNAPSSPQEDHRYVVLKPKVINPGLEDAAYVLNKLNREGLMANPENGASGTDISLPSFVLHTAAPDGTMFLEDLNSRTPTQIADANFSNRFQ